MAETPWPEWLIPVIVEEIIDPNTGWITQARIGGEVCPGATIPLRTAEIEQFFAAPVATYALLENGNVWRLKWKAHQTEGVEVRVFPDGSEQLGIDKLSLARTGHTASHLPTVAEHILGFSLGATFRGSRIGRILIEAAPQYDYQAALAWTHGRYSDLRTRDRIERDSAWNRHDAQGPTVVDLGDDHTGAARYGVRLDVLDPPAGPDGAADRLGLRGEFQYALVGTGDEYRAWHLIRPGEGHPLPLVTGFPLNDQPDSPRIEVMYGVVAPGVVRGHTPMGVRPITDSGIDPTVLRGINARLRSNTGQPFGR